MVVNRRRKVVKYRGHSNHGGGMRKKRRGAGSRGGRGMAGTGKRAGQKKAGMPLMLGSRGFVPRRTVVSVCAVNVSYFTPVVVERLVAAKKAVKQGKVVEIDLGSLGYNKLLGTGSTSVMLKLQVASASPGAIEKIKAAGGEVVILA